MKTRCTNKTMNWQDVTLEQLSSHWDLVINELPTPLDFEVAKYMNAFAYGDIAGDGIDVRCECADEVVDTYSRNIKAIDIHDELYKMGWSTNVYNSNLLEMQRGGDIAMFHIEYSGEVAYMAMTITNEYADECSSVIEEYYEQAETIINLFGRRVVVNEGNIIDLFQQVAKKYFDNTEDAGDGMRNVYFDDIIIQVYPYNEYHDVWVLTYDFNKSDWQREDCELKEFPFEKQIEYLKMYYEKLSGDKNTNIQEDLEVLAKLKEETKMPAKGPRKIDKNALQERFIGYCQEKGAYCYRNEYAGTNDMVKEIVYITKLGLVYYYFDNNGEFEMPTMDVIAYPIPSKLKDEGIINYLIEECLNANMYVEIREIADFLAMGEEKQNVDGVPHEYFYGWVWENGSWDKYTEREKLSLITQEEKQIQEDCVYLKSIYPMLKDGWHISADGSQHTDTTSEFMVGNAEQFCTYYKESGLGLQEFLAQYDDVSRKDSLWSKCCEFAEYLVKNYLGEDVYEHMNNDLADMMHSYIIEKSGSSYFPKNGQVS